MLPKVFQVKMSQIIRLSASTRTSYAYKKYLYNFRLHTHIIRTRLYETVRDLLRGRTNYMTSRITHYTYTLYTFYTLRINVHTRTRTSIKIYKCKKCKTFSDITHNYFSHHTYLNLLAWKHGICVRVMSDASMPVARLHKRALMSMFGNVGSAGIA